MKKTQTGMHCSQAGHGFTLIELLVVVAIIAVLISLLLPALSSARETAKKVVCGSNLGQTSKAIYLYSQDNMSWLPAYESTTVTDPKDKTGGFVGSFVHDEGGIAKLVKKPVKVLPSNKYVTLCYAPGSTGYLENCDALFCPADTTYAPKRFLNPIDSHGWAPYWPDKYYTLDYHFNSSGFWYMYVPENEAMMGYATVNENPYFKGMKRYKVDCENPTQTTILSDIGQCPQFGLADYKMSHQNGGWNALYVDGHVKFHRLENVWAVVGGYGYSRTNMTFQYFDSHP